MKLIKEIHLKVWPLASHLSRSLRVIGIDTYRSATFDFLLTFHIDISAECLPLYNPVNRKIRLIFGQAEFCVETKFTAKIRLQPNVYG